MFIKNRIKKLLSAQEACNFKKVWNLRSCTWNKRERFVFIRIIDGGINYGKILNAVEKEKIGSYYD